MYPGRAIILALDAIIQVVESAEGYRWQLDPQLPGLLRDYQALGYRLIGVLNPQQFGLSLVESLESAELVAYVDELLQAAKAPSLHAVYLTDDVTDPRPLWELRGQFGLSLQQSVLVGTGDGYEQLQANAGISRLEWADQVLGAAYRPMVRAAS